MMKASLHNLCPMVNTHRMVMDYWTKFYNSAAKRRFQLKENGWEGVKALAGWREKIMLNWTKVVVKDIRMDPISEIEIGVEYHSEVVISHGEPDAYQEVDCYDDAENPYHRFFFQVGLHESFQRYLPSLEDDFRVDQDVDRQPGNEHRQYCREW